MINKSQVTSKLGYNTMKIAQIIERHPLTMKGNFESKPKRRTYTIVQTVLLVRFEMYQADANAFPSSECP